MNQPPIFSIRDNKITEITRYADRSEYFDEYETVFMTGGGFDCDYHIIGKNAFYKKEEAKEKLKESLNEQIKNLQKILEEI